MEPARAQAGSSAPAGRAFLVTPYAHRLVRLTGSTDWEADWDNHRFEVIADLWWTAIHGPYPAPEWLSDVPHHQLDWGAWIYELSLDQVRELCPKPQALDWLHDGWHEQDAMLASLDPGRNYGVIVMEEAEPLHGPGHIWTTEEQPPFSDD